MMKKLLTYITMLVAFCGVLSSCEDIEDTYKEHAGDGPIQYLNKIYDLEATSQWESVLLTWNLKRGFWWNGKMIPLPTLKCWTKMRKVFW